MPNSTQIVYLSKTQYAELIANQSITVDGVTVNYNENDIYVTPQAEPITDVRVNETSISSNGIANIPVASASVLGVVKGDADYGTEIANQRIKIVKAADDQIQIGTHTSRPITPYSQHLSTFYGLSKAAGADLASTSGVVVGEYPNASKAAIQSMLGIPSLLATDETTGAASKAYAVNDIFAANGKLYKVTAAIAQDGTIEPGTNCEVVKANEVFVKRTDYANNTTAGVVKVTNAYGININGTGFLAMVSADDSNIQNASSDFKAITPRHQHASVFYGLAKAAGDSTQAASDNAIGTYTSNASAAIRSMIGAGEPLDVQVNGTSAVSNGVANIPVASADTLGVVKFNSGQGITRASDNSIAVNPAVDNNYKLANDALKPMTTAKEHWAVFYGLAKAAGDATQSASSNAVGTYTTEAKAAIHTMLGIDPASIAAQVEIPLVETVSGTTPSITGQPNTRYVCGEVSTISITPPASGTVDVIFESGSSVAILTVPNTVKWPAWFDATSLDTNTTYELLITDGVYGSVMTWAT